MYIEQVNSPQDIKQFSAEQLRQLAGEVRNALLTKLSAHGGHVGPTQPFHLVLLHSSLYYMCKILS